MTEPLRAVRFHRGMAPYEAMDIAGFAVAKAQDLVDRGIAEFWPPDSAPIAADAETPVVDVLSDMTRAELLAFAEKHVGAADEPPADTTDEELRIAIRASVNAKLLVVPKKKA